MAKRILLVFGTRPEAIKMAPVIHELKRYPELFEVVVCVTAQHRRMLDQVLELFGIVPDFDLDIMCPDQDLYDISAKVLLRLRKVLADVNPDLVLVHGDTTTSMASALAAFYARIPVGHIEAGLRTGNKYAPFPEELNRSIVGYIGDIHFAPTLKAKDNLIKLGVSDDSIHVTGNTVIDALFLAVEKIRAQKLSSKIKQDLMLSYPSLCKVFLNHGRKSDEQKIILVTGHRRENFGEGFENICCALREIARNNADVQIIYPVHLNPKVQEPVFRILEECDSIHLVDPLDYLPFVYLMHRSYLVITDSGGVQEEAPSLGKPVLVTREITERPEAVEAGTVRLVGADQGRIVAETTKLLRDKEEYDAMSIAHNPYGDGFAAGRVQTIIFSFFHERVAGHPCK